MEGQLEINEKDELIKHTLVEQIIKRFNENEEEINPPVVNQFTLEELSYLVLPQNVIDNKRHNKDLKLIWKDIVTPDLPGEQWALLPNNNKNYIVSNFGRIKHNGKILEQENKTINGVEKIGYLVIAKNDYSDKENLAKEKCIYEFVAETFLGKFVWDGYEIHHITNNGYDNRPENLILLTKEQHYKVHALARKL